MNSFFEKKKLSMGFSLLIDRVPLLLLLFFTSIRLKY